MLPSVDISVRRGRSINIKIRAYLKAFKPLSEVIFGRLSRKICCVDTILLNGDRSLIKGRETKVIPIDSLLSSKKDMSFRYGKLLIEIELRLTSLRKFMLLQSR
jgi:hypothetical protein